MRGAVLGRLRQASYGGNTGMAPLAFGGPQAFADGEELSALAYAKSPVVKAPLVAPAPTSDVVFWAQGFGAWGRFNGDGNAASVRRDLAGFITGLDTRVGDERPRRHRRRLHRLAQQSRRPRQRERRDRPCGGLWRLELWRAQPARRRRLCVPCDRHRPHHRVPRLLRSRDRAL